MKKICITIDSKSEKVLYLIKQRLLLYESVSKSVRKAIKGYWIPKINKKIQEDKGINKENELKRLSKGREGVPTDLGEYHEYLRNKESVGKNTEAD